MSSELLNLLDSLPGELFFYLENGMLKNKLVECYMEEEDAQHEILEFEHNASLRIRPGEGAAAPSFDCRLEAGDFHYQIIFSTTDFTADERIELLDYLRPHCSAHAKQAGSSGRNIIRKQQGNELLGISAAAKALGLSHRSLKSLIPCSETRITEQSGQKSIKEYYWDKQLIARFESLWLKQQQGRGYNREDLTVIAECCCAGDRQWARDCINDFINQRKLAG